MPKQSAWAALRRSYTFCSLYSAAAKLSTKLCETADVTSNLGSDSELFEIEKEAIQNQKAACR